MESFEYWSLPHGVKTSPLTCNFTICNYTLLITTQNPHLVGHFHYNIIEVSKFSQASWHTFIFTIFVESSVRMFHLV